MSGGGSAGASGGTLPVRFFIQLADGSSCGGDTGPSATFTHALPCHPNMSFGDIKTKLWSKLGNSVSGASAATVAPPDAYVFQLATGEVNFEDDDVLSRFIAINEIFRESGSLQSAAGGGPSATERSRSAAVGGADSSAPMLECLVVHRDFVADRYTRESRPVPGMCGLVQHRAPLQLRSEGMTGPKWKNRYGVIQNMALFVFDNEEAYNKRDMSAVEFLLLGSAVAVRLEPQSSDRGHVFSFELKRATAPVSAGGIAPPSAAGSKGAAESKLIFYAESESSLNAWIAAINRQYLRRLKYIAVSIVEELESRGLESSEGLFRLSAGKAAVEQLQLEFDAGKAPNLGLILDEHVLSNCLKNGLRNMPEPLLTFEAYTHMIKLAHDHGSSHGGGEAQSLQRRLDALKAVIEKLPHANQGLIEYLMSFLSRVADNASINRMSAANLSIVFSPNILRPRVENVTSIMADSKQVQDCVELLIIHARDLWVNFGNTRRTSRLAFFTGSRPRQGKTPPMPSGLATVSEGAPAHSHAQAPPSSSQAQTQSSQPSSSPLSGTPLPPPGRRGGPTPPPPRSSPTASGPSEPKHLTASTAELAKALAAGPPPASSPKGPPAGGVSYTMPTGAFALPAMSGPLMLRKTGGPGAGGPPPLKSTQSLPVTARSPDLKPSSPVVEQPAAPAAPAASSPPLEPVANPGVMPELLLPQAGTASLAALPEELLALSEQSSALGDRWVSSLGVSQRGMTNAMTLLLDAHAQAMHSGAMTSEDSSATALVVQRCVNVLAADMARFEQEYANLIRFVHEQVATAKKTLTAAKPAAAAAASASSRVAPKPAANRLARTSSATKPTRRGPPPLPSPVTATTLPAPPVVPVLPAAPAATTAVPAPASHPPAVPPPPLVRPEAGDLVEALHDYAGGSDSLSLTRGDRLLLIEGDEHDTEWWLCRRVTDSVEGFVPAAYVGFA